jgi:hypothetical protein
MHMFAHAAQVVIVKTPRDDAPETAANDLECELLLLKELTHPNIIAILFAGHHAGRRFIGLEALLGGTLADRVEKLNRKMPIVEVCVTRPFDRTSTD